MDETPFILKFAYGQAPQPIWSGWALLTVEIYESREPILQATTPDGRNEEIRFSAPGWTRLSSVSVWGGENGEVVLAGSGQDESGERAGYIGWVEKDRSRRQIARIEKYFPDVMTVGPGGVVWAICSDPSDQLRPVFNILARFSPDGKLLNATYLTNRDILGGGSPDKDGIPRGSWDVARNSTLRASSDRIAWLTTKNEYLEFDTSGAKTYRISGPPGLDRDTWGERLAITGSNTVLVSKRNSANARKPRQEFWSLDRLKRTWFQSEAAEGSFPPGTELYGFDGTDFITSGYQPVLGRLLVRYRPSETK